MKKTEGQFTTLKLQALLDSGVAPAIRNRRDLAHALATMGHRISTHAIESWFRHVDANHGTDRISLSGRVRTYPLPKRRWPALLRVFGIAAERLRLPDDDFATWCLGGGQSFLAASGRPIAGVLPPPADWALSACRRFGRGRDAALLDGDLPRASTYLHRLARAQLALGRIDEALDTSVTIERLSAYPIDPNERLLGLAAIVAASALWGDHEQAEHVFAQGAQLLYPSARPAAALALLSAGVFALVQVRATERALATASSLTRSTTRPNALVDVVQAQLRAMVLQAAGERVVCPSCACLRHADGLWPSPQANEVALYQGEEARPRPQAERAVARAVAWGAVFSPGWPHHLPTLAQSSVTPHRAYPPAL